VTGVLNPEYGYFRSTLVTGREQTIYFESLTEEKLAHASEADKRAAVGLTSKGYLPAVLYVDGAPPTIANVPVSAAFSITQEQFEAAKANGWPEAGPIEITTGSPSHGGEVGASGDLSLEVTRAEDG
jgi:hypothetical protein